MSNFQVYSPDLLADKLLEKRERGPVALKTGLPEVDKIFSIRKGFILFTGYPGNGKSHMLDWLYLLACRKHKIMCNVYSPEAYPIEEYVEHLIRIWTGRSTNLKHKNHLTDDEVRDAAREIAQYWRIFDFDEPPEVREVLAAFKQHPAFLNVVDPFNFLESDQDASLFDRIRSAASQFKNFSTHEDCNITVVEHPKEPGPNDRDEKGRVRPPGLFSLFGGSMWRNKIDIAVTVHIEDYPKHDWKDNTVMFRTTKIKNQAVYGRPGEAFLKFDYMKQRYILDKVDYFTGEKIAPF